MNNIEVKLIPYEQNSHAKKLNNTLNLYIMSTKEFTPSGVNMINAPFMWRNNFKGKGVTIAVIDTGCATNHPDLINQIIGGRNFTEEDGSNPNIYEDYNGHGTHICGTIAAKAQNIGLVGVAPEAKLLVLKVLNKNGNGDLQNLVKAIEYAISQNVNIISMSLGTPEDIPELHNIIKLAVERNVLVVCAAGNKGDGNASTNEFSYPGSYNEVISVGAIDNTRSAARFTNSNKEVDLVAPGVDITSTYLNNTYRNLSGTSMATPHVSGALALLIQWARSDFNRDLTEPELYAQLIKNTTELNLKRTLQGNGMLYLKSNISNNIKIKLIPYEKDTQSEKLNNALNLYIRSTIEFIPSGVNMINAPFMWRNNFKGNGVTIAVIDTGCATNHPDLIDQIIGGRNFTEEDDSNPNIYEDYNGHGTHVCGIIAAKAQNIGLIGVAPEAKLLVLKVLNKNGIGDSQNLVNAIEYAISQNVNIISMSLGAPVDIPELHNVIKMAIEKNILVVCAAGNKGDGNAYTDEFSYPGAYNEVISVGAIDNTRSAARFTNSNKEVDLVAPGVDITSTFLNNTYRNLSGTSMATPHVSGALALLIQWARDDFDRELTEPELYAQLVKNTTELNLIRTLQGNGMLYLKPKNL